MLLHPYIYFTGIATNFSYLTVYKMQCIVIALTAQQYMKQFKLAATTCGLQVNESVIIMLLLLDTYIEWAVPVHFCLRFFCCMSCSSLSHPMSPACIDTVPIQ